MAKQIIVFFSCNNERIRLAKFCEDIVPQIDPFNRAHILNRKLVEKRKRLAECDQYQTFIIKDRDIKHFLI